jgi:hypothetical protein
LQAGVSIASGENFLGFNTTKSKVWYLDLEESAPQMQARLERQLSGQSAPADLLITHEFSTMNDFFIEDMERILTAYENQISLVIIDVFAMVQKAKKSNESDYTFIYENFQILRKIIALHGCSILLIMHDRKFTDDTDPFANILGSTAIMGASDFCLTIHKKQRSDQDATLSTIGRAISMDDYSIRFNKDTLKWEMLGSSLEILEQRQREAYEKNPLVMAIKKGLELSPHGFKSSCKDLLLAANKYGYKVNMTPQKASKELDALENKLRYYDAIIIDHEQNGTGGGKRIFKPLFG